MLEQALIKEDSNNRVAALNLDSFIIEAPAGAGKTELLTQRYLKLLQTVDAPEEVIAITFTNKAASEMRMRIMDSLQMADTGIPPEAPHKQITFELGQAALARSAKLEWNLLATPSKLRVYTIDSLCGNLARQMPLLSRFGAQPGVIEDTTSYYREAASKALAHLDSAEHTEAIQAVLRYFDNDQYKLSNLLVSMLGMREQWLEYANTDATLAAAERALQHLIEAELQTISATVHEVIQKKIMPIARFAANNLEAEHPIHALLDWDAPLETTIESLSQWRGLTEFLLTAGKPVMRKSANVKLGLPASDEAKPYKDALKTIYAELAEIPHFAETMHRVRALTSPHLEQDSRIIIEALSHVLNVAVGELWLAFQRDNAVDFIEVAQRALQALLAEDGESSELAMRLDYQIKHLLVDEFQDTSPVQIALLKALTNGWQPDDGRTLFAVGDPMQSIYRFRKANVSLFLDVATHGIGHIQLKSLKLWRNNRSCPAVVNWVNQTFTPLFPNADNPNQGAIQYRPFVATKADQAGAGVTIHPMLKQKSSSDDGLAPDIRQLEAERIIAIINQTLAEKPDANIAVLVRARAHLHALVIEMRRNHPELTFQAVEIEELANRQVVQDLMSLTYALHQRADRVHWLALLRAPWCGLTLADLHTLIGGDGNSTIMRLMSDESRVRKLSEDGQHRLRHVRDVMQQALDFRGRTSISRWVHNTWLMLGGAACLWANSDVQDVQAFFKRIQTLEQNGQFSTAMLAEDVKKLYAAPSSKTTHDIQFMTLHKSKGLEFDTVILPGLDAKPPSNSKPLLLWEEVLMDGELSLLSAPLPPSMSKQTAKNEQSAYDYLFSLENMRDALEDVRELYVAATRAERHLHLLGAVSEGEKGEYKAIKNSYLHILLPSIHHAFTEDQFIKAPESTGDQQTSLAQFVPQLLRLKAAGMPALLRNTEIPVANHQQNLPKPTDAAILEADIGTLTHLYLELIANSQLEDWLGSSFEKVIQAAPAMQRWLLQRGYDQTTADDAAKQVQTLLTTTLASKDGQWVLSAHEQAESELAIETASEQNKAKKQVIDRTFVENNTRWIIDYKTTALPTDIDDTALAEKAQDYAVQLTAYASLFAHESYRIQKAVYFVSVGRLALID